MDKVIEIAKFIEVDKTKKYLLLLKDDTLDIEKVANEITGWLERNDMPLMIAFENQVHLLEVVEKDE